MMLPSRASGSPPDPGDTVPARPSILTIAVEDYYHASAFRSLITTQHWHRFEPRIECNTHRTLDLLDEYGVKATFFVLGWVADEMPQVLREIVRRGHEVASKGYFHRTIQEMNQAEFRQDLRRSLVAIEQASGSRVLGYRVARGHLGLRDLWALDVIAEEGLEYDSSFYPRGRSVAAQPWRRFPFKHRHAGAELVELPLSTWDVNGWHVPIAGGAYLRHIPHRVMHRIISSRMRESDAPLVMYFHVWELDQALPKITAAPGHTQMRQYRNLKKMDWRLRYYLKRYPFESVRDHLQLRAEPAKEQTRQAVSAHSNAGAAVSAQPILPIQAPGGIRVPVTLVMPCFNEEQVLPYLANTLKRLASDFAALYELRFVFVDDGSSDATWPALQRIFGGQPHFRLVRHERNRGVAAAILTGVRHAETEIVCSIDCDCTYDPTQIGGLIPLLTEDVAVVTASPYHPQGEVKNVPAWRLLLSKGLSFMYGCLFKQQLHTYTSCFRAYRRSRVVDIELRESGFLGVAELLVLLDQRGERIVEFPAVLEVRLLGHSKMKLLRTIGGHLGLLRRMLATRWRSSRSAMPVRPVQPKNAPR